MADQNQTVDLHAIAALMGEDDGRYPVQCLTLKVPQRRFKLRLSQETSDMLKDCALHLKCTESEVIRMGLMLMDIYHKRSKFA